MSGPESFAFIVMVVSGGVTISSVARAYMRRLEARDRATAHSTDAGTAERLARIEHAVESIAVEVERVSEGQRFTTKLLAERATPPIRERVDAYRGTE